MGLVVTDLRISANIVGMGENVADWELYDDFVTHPMTKRYRRKDDKRSPIIAAISGLRHRLPDKSFVTEAFEGSGPWYFGNNTFAGVVDEKARIGITRDAESYVVAPVLKIGAEVVHPLSCRLLETDPVNPDLHYNTLEWNYGVALRRLRVIKGSYCATWHPVKTVKSDVAIDYGKGAGNARLGSWRLGNDITTSRLLITTPTSELIPAALWIPGAIVGDSAPFESNADYVDGITAHSHSAGTNETWAHVRDGDGSYKSDFDDGNTSLIDYVAADTGTDKWQYMYRGIMQYNTSSLSGATVTGWTLVTVGVDKGDTLGVTPTVVLTESAPASAGALAISDYQTVTDATVSSAVTYAGFNASGNNTFTGSDNTVIDVEGVTKLAYRSGPDQSDTAPSWSSGNRSFHQSYSAGNGSNEPILTVTYTPAATGNPWYLYQRRQ